MSFPPRRQRRAALVTAVVLAVTALVAGLALPLAQADDLDEQHDEVKQSITRTVSHLEEASAQLGAALRRLERAQDSLRTARNRYYATRVRLQKAIEVDAVMRQRLNAARVSLHQARVDLQAGQVAMAAQRDDIGRLAAQNYAHGDPGLLKVEALLNSHDLTDLTLRMNTIDGLMVREDAALDTLAKLRDQLAAQERKVAAHEERVEKGKLETKRVLVRRQTFARVARNQRNAVLRLVNSRAVLARQARQLRQRDLRRLRRLEAEEDRIRQAILDRDAAAEGGYTGASGGFLSRPVPGVVTSPFGYRRHPIYGYWGLHNGTDFSTPCGQQMRAGASGTVVDVYYSSVYGNRLLLDVGRVNGRNLTLVYNHATGYAVGEGSRVRRGDVVGYAGSTGWSTGCHLHFTVLRSGTPVDPMNYM